jgi:hypothetical protein
MAFMSQFPFAPSMSPFPFARRILGKSILSYIQ